MPRSTVLALVPLLLSSSLAGCSSPARGDTPTEKSSIRAVGGAERGRRVRFDAEALARLGVVTEAAGSESPKHAVNFPGTLGFALDRYGEVGSIVDGRVQSVNANVGDVVKRGQTLASIAVPALVQAQAELLTARAAVRAAESNARREDQLLERSLTTAREQEVAREQAERSRAELAAAEMKIGLLAGGATARASGQAGAIALVAPIDGVVVRREIVLGGRIAASETAFVVADLSKLWAVVDVFESDLQHVKVGGTARLVLDAVGGTERTAVVAAVEPALGVASRSARARLVVDNADGALKAGMFFRAELPIDGARKADALFLPSGAVQPLGDEDVVFVEAAPGDYEIRPVKVVGRSPQVVEVAQGVSKGERIVVKGAAILRSEATKQ